MQWKFSNFSTVLKSHSGINKKWIDEDINANKEVETIDQISFSSLQCIIGRKKVRKCRGTGEVIPH